MDETGRSPTSLTQSSGAFLSPLLISLAGVVVTSLSMVVYHLVLDRYCMRRPENHRHPFTRSPMIQSNGQSDDETRGVEKKILDTIPILSFSAEKGNLFREDQSECVVCLGELEDGETVRLLPNCRHVFHDQCIDNWFSEHKSCPVCRSTVNIVAEIGPVETLPTGDQIGEIRLHQNNIIPQIQEQDRDIGGASSSAAGVRSNASYRHSVSLVFPTERKPRHLVSGRLMRSLSVDQSYVLINLLLGESEKAASSSSCSRSLSMPKCGFAESSSSYRARSMRELDRMSSRLLRSFSQLRIGSSRTNAILPY